MQAKAFAADVDTVIKGVESAYSDVTTLQAGFVQISRSAAMGETKQKGKVALERPRKMRWTFTQPPGKLFVTDGATMWIWSKADNQVVISNVAGGQGKGDMTQLLDNLDKLGELFDVQLQEDGKASYVLDLTPKQEGNIQRIELKVSKNQYMVEQVKTIDGFGNEVELRFHGVKTNGKVPSSSFSFEVPSGAQVLQADGP